MPISVAGVSANSSLACLRVWSIVDSGVRVRPAASPSTANRLTPLPVRAATRIRFAVCPSSTKHLRAGEREAVAAGRGLGGDARLVPLARRLGEGQRGDRLAAGDAREVRLLGGVVARLQQRVGGEHHGREVRGAQQRPAHLLEHDAELDVAVARAAELLGDGQALQAHLLAHLRPDGRVEALLGLHLLAHGGLRRSWRRGTLRTVLRSSSCSSVKAKFMGARIVADDGPSQVAACTPMYTRS